MKDHKLLIPGKEIQNRKPGQPLRFASNINGIGGNHLHLIMGTLPAILEQGNTPALPVKDLSSANDTHALPHNAYSSDAEGKKLRMVALLSGQGSQYSGMMKELFQSDAHIRSIMEQGETIFQEQRGYSLLDLMFGNNADNTDKDKDLNSTNNTQPAVFLSSAAIYSRLAMEGFAPDYYIGHSVGEYTALYCSGILSFDHAMRLIIKRSDLMYQSTLEEPGKIMVVFANEKNTGKFIQESGISDIYITNKNSEKQTAVSGKAQSIEDFCVYLKTRKVVFRKLNLTGAFHTPLLKGASEKLRTFLDTLDFAPTNYGRIISNTLAAPYPKTSGEVKDLLARQIISPVEFIKSVEYVYASGKTHFVEIGPSRLLVNLLKDINIGEYGTAVSVDRKKGEIASFADCRDYLSEHNALFSTPAAREPEKSLSAAASPKPEDSLAVVDLSDEFEDFKRNNQKVIDKILFEEFQRRKRDAAIEALERFEFNTRPVVISGVSVGLPGKTRHVFAKDNFDAILNGKNFIESLDQKDQDRLIDKNIIKLYKQPDGNARFVQITKTEDVIHLAGQLGYFNLNDEYGIKEEYDIAMALGIAAGIEALKDANIPLVMQYKSLKDGKTLVPDGFALPEEMQEDTGVIITSLW
ncbi:MAG: polyketide synthase, partial [Desulfobacterales bacterium]